MTKLHNGDFKCLSNTTGIINVPCSIKDDAINHSNLQTSFVNWKSLYSRFLWWMNSTRPRIRPCLKYMYYNCYWYLSWIWRFINLVSVIKVLHGSARNFQIIVYFLIFIAVVINRVVWTVPSRYFPMNGSVIICIEAIISIGECSLSDLHGRTPHPLLSLLYNVLFNLPSIQLSHFISSMECDLGWSIVFMSILFYQFIFIFITYLGCIVFLQDQS